MSATHTTFGEGGRKLAFDEVGGGRDARDPDSRLPAPSGPDARDTGGLHQPGDALRPTRTLCSSRSSARIRGAPYTPRPASWIRLIFSVSQASWSARSDGARRSQLWKPVRFTPNTRHITATG